MRIAVALLTFTLAAPAAAETVDGDAITVIDGDTIILPCDPARGIWRHCGERVRLIGIDTPEIGTHARCPAEAEVGTRAATRLRELLAGGPVEVDRVDRDRWGRTLARITGPGGDVEAAMLAAGLALPWRAGRAAWANRCRHWCPGTQRCKE
jgi:endonuclease YncB( thermonuclease family)